MAEEERNSGEENQSAQKKSSNLILIIVIVVLILTLIVGGLMIFLMSSGDEENSQQSNATQMTDNNNQGGSIKRAKPSERIVGIEVGPMYPLDGFTINLLSDSGRRYLKTTITLELTEERLSDELNKKKSVIRDVVIGVLSSNTLEAIATAKGKEKLKDTLVDQLNMRLKDGRVKNVYFDEFVIQ